VSELPPGWTSATVADLIAPDGIFSDGNWVESKDQDPAGAIRLLQLADVGDGVFVDKSNRFVNDDKFEQLRCTEVFEGDVLIARMPDPLGRACLAPKLRQRCITVVDVAIVRPGPSSVRPKWLMHFLNAPPVRQVIELQSSGTTRRRISRGNLAQLELPVPPLPEQRRIADKLDALFARVDACRERLDRVPGILKRFRQSVLTAATSGDLTREDRGNSEPWREAALSDLIGDQGLFSDGDWVESKDQDPAGGIRLIQLADIGDGAFVDKSSRFVNHAAFERLKCTALEPGDVLVARMPDPLGRACVLPDLGYHCITVVDVAILRPKNAAINPVWLMTALNAPDVRAEIGLLASGTTRQRVSRRNLAGIMLRVPPVAEQRKIVRRVESLFAYADNLEQRFKATRSVVQRLTPSTLATAFRGELVPQDPNDEPASELLAQLRPRSSSTGNTGRQKRGGTRGSRTKAKAGTNMLTRKDVTPTHLTTILKARGALTAEALWTASQLEIDDFYDQLKDEEACGQLRENRGDAPNAPRLLEPAA
jgi:type I restriction enzyme, S subunit